MSIWPSIVAVLGTLAGALTAGLLQHRSARTARAEERADSHARTSSAPSPTSRPPWTRTARRWSIGSV
ncbi:hypothetical protein ACFXPY_42110 [Streptomyces sp. NPDC059153]|uniref:hypothetical protein n=1 Tax=Streptomyces sp. NPDC059153 TaxID=3346743 RepID=UPI0036B5FA64